MKVIINDDKILINNETGSIAYTVMTKPEIDDYSNLTVKPLVTNYHLVQETIWKRSCRVVQEMQDSCKDSPYFACYIMLFASLYPMLISSSQAKNIICYGMNRDEGVLVLFQDFMGFLQENNSLIDLPPNPFALSAILNKSCHAALVSLDACTDNQTIYDAISKLRNGGLLLLYTNQDKAIDESLSHLATKQVFDSCIIYAINIDERISTAAFENNSESMILPIIDNLMTQFEDLNSLTNTIVQTSGLSLESYPYAITLTNQIERNLIELYDIIEQPRLPIFANAMKEALMDCYIAASNRLDMETCLERLYKETDTFNEAMISEFKS